MPLEQIIGASDPPAWLDGARQAVIPDRMSHSWENPPVIGTGPGANATVFPLFLGDSGWVVLGGTPVNRFVSGRTCMELVSGAVPEEYAVKGMFAPWLLASEVSGPVAPDSVAVRCDLLVTFDAAGTDPDGENAWAFVITDSTGTLPTRWTAGFNASAGVAIVGDGAGGLLYQSRQIQNGPIAESVALTWPVPLTSWAHLSFRYVRARSSARGAELRVLVNGQVLISRDWDTDAAVLPTSVSTNLYWRPHLQASTVAGRRTMYFDNLVLAVGDERLFTGE